MKIEVLASVMYQKDHLILEKMNINTNAIIVNQCDENKFEEFIFKGNKIKFISLNERGIGLSRNTALMRASSDIVLFADDDVIYNEKYENIIIDAFNKNANADMIVCNLEVTNINYKKRKLLKNNQRIRKFNALRHGAVSFAVKLEKLRYSNIYFSLLFGGGARYSSGEDSLFMFELLKHKFKIYYCDKQIGTVAQEKSTWFKGYNDKFFYDKGVIFFYLFGLGAKLMCFEYILRHIEQCKDVGINKAFKLMNDGIKEAKNR